MTTYSEIQRYIAIERVKIPFQIGTFRGCKCYYYEGPIEGLISLGKSFNKIYFFVYNRSKDNFSIYRDNFLIATIENRADADIEFLDVQVPLENTFTSFSEERSSGEKEVKEEKLYVDEFFENLDKLYEEMFSKTEMEKVVDSLLDI